MALSDEIKIEILNNYYENVYQEYLFSSGLQSIGINWFEKKLEEYWENRQVKNLKVLELGAGNGEHLPYVSPYGISSYTCLDLRQAKNFKEHLKNLDRDFARSIKFIQGNAEQLPFKEKSFHRVSSTCLLHHVDDPLQVLLEARRVTMTKGELAFLLPTDPGLVNYLIKKIISYPKIRKISNLDPELIYALEHKNHFRGILTLIKFVFKDDTISVRYSPFKMPSYNLNALCVVHIVKS
jgi:ubiquinone/menaquinone biosynthesis C-methylase UbiE